MDHGLPIYSLDYLTQKVQTHELEWYMVRRTDAIKKHVTVTKTTSPQLTKQYQE